LRPRFTFRERAASSFSIGRRPGWTSFSLSIHPPFLLARSVPFLFNSGEFEHWLSEAAALPES
jgi:hypothetical protein